jgi:hypothetical protein
VRVALALPVSSTAHVRAATQIVAFLVQVVGKTEIDLLRQSDMARPAGRPGEGDFLLVAANRELSVDNGPSARPLGAIRSGWVEREYARQGIAPVGYDLQML